LSSSSASTSSRLLLFSSLIPLPHHSSQPPMVAPYPPCTAQWAAREVGARREGEKVEERATCVLPRRGTGGHEGGGDSHAGKTKNNGAHGDQKGEHEQPLLQEQQQSPQPQPQSQQ
jgi:hypothetical protein